MEKSPKRGKIPPQDWPSIIARYQAGETLASIARTYDCSPPAISYIVSRTRARNATTDPQNATASAESQLLKREPPVATSSDAASSADSVPQAGASAMAAPNPVEIHGERTDPPLQQQEALRLFSGGAPAPVLRRDPARLGEHQAMETPDQRPHDPQPGDDANLPSPSASSAGAPPPGEPRRTLHLSLSGGDTAHRHEREPHPPQAQNSADRGFGERAAAPLGVAGAAGTGARPFPPTGNGAPMRPPQEPSAAREGGVYIDQALRERVGDDVAAFLAAFDAALSQDSAENRTGLREATDRLLRAGARTRIELERLEARVPLVPREKAGQEQRGFRPR